MIQSYGSRPPMDRLAPEALAAYVEWGTHDRSDGQVELACPPAIEAAMRLGDRRSCRLPVFFFGHVERDVDLTARAKIAADGRAARRSGALASPARSPSGRRGPGPARAG